ncbi:tryptophan--tRNA ligase [Candidatus Actinomarina sp.]|jgi:tryptophanyl-tRNA synthetase|nr:tryptophan--tRNA ligase [Acidimicrobiaceae bacterium]MDA8653430.1 tryptophan--tRNA ligase [Candidatus Actinomarina sp.]MDA8964410.1 tryptophan--tRNA ligase [Acidimicrobiia bacterium]MDA8710086.1 tryptophan--tRNA ligase [Candidatus Actinomarina sp.]MDA8813420.1 tryptophan--tRNA ligase [Candidatus Actinomarina sp.]|tara:strand:- start:4521 stop:5492 length:972 start_codon:yes stop_codon:yes gene_type:complete
MKTVFSGIQPTGKVHLGNFLGAIKNWVHLSNVENKNFFCVVDLHSITTHPDPMELKSNIEQTLKLLIAAGINLDNSIIYAQSSVPQHAYLSWILSSFCQVGELQRMTQYKEKADSLGSHAGIFTYPVLMASDILIHKANEVPVGDDQTQHLELTRNIAERFNNKYGDVFPLPEKSSGKSGARLMSLKHPDSKMSKSSDDINGTIYFDDDKDTIMKKFKSSVTDSDDIIQYNLSEKKGISNLIDIYASINGMSHKEVEKTFMDSRYGEFKMAVGECVAEYLNPINLKFIELEKENISEIVKINLQEAQASAELTIQEVNNILGL